MKSSKTLTDIGILIIVDFPIAEDLQESLSSLSLKRPGKIYFLDFKREAMIMEQMIKNNLNLNLETSLLIFPGESAWSLSKEINFSGLEKIKSFSKRIWIPGQNPVVVSHSLEYKKMIDWQIKSILVIDDVVSSGQTMKKLKERNCWRFPKALWQGACLLSRKNKLTGFEYFFTSILLEEKQKTPINTLSTLLKDRELSLNYAQRNFYDSKVFMDLLERIKQPLLI